MNTFYVFLEPNCTGIKKNFESVSITFADNAVGVWMANSAVWQFDMVGVEILPKFKLWRHADMMRLDEKVCSAEIVYRKNIWMERKSDFPQQTKISWLQGKSAY